MAYRRYHIGGLSFSVTANDSGLGLQLSFNGRLWERLAHFIQMRRNRNRREQLITSEESFQERANFVNEVEHGELLSSTVQSDLAQLIDSFSWYHTHDFGDGIKTKGLFDHTPILDRYKLPESFSGKRILDVATFDGFWAFEFERRGAREVVALDLDRPAELDLPPKRLARATDEELALKFGRGFEIAKTQFKSKVQRVTCNIYDLAPSSLGTFDIVHAGDVLLHLNGPVRALQNIAKVCTDYALISEVYYPELEHFGTGRLMEYLGGHSDVTWWKFSLATLEQMILDAGFSRLELLATFKYGPREMPETMHHAVFKAYK